MKQNLHYFKIYTVMWVLVSSNSKFFRSHDKIVESLNLADIGPCTLLACKKIDNHVFQK